MASSQVKATVSLIIVVVALFAMGPVIVEQEETATADASTWNFTGAEGAEALVGLAPFVYYGAVLLVMVGGAFAIAKFGTGGD